MEAPGDDGSACRTRCSKASGESFAMHGLWLWQTPTWPAQVQGPPCSTRCCLPRGAHWLITVGPNKATVGTPKPAAKCRGPVSPAINNRARLITARNVARSEERRVGKEC